MKTLWESTGYKCESEFGTFTVHTGYGDAAYPVTRRADGDVTWLGGVANGLPHFYPSAMTAMAAVEAEIARLRAEQPGECVEAMRGLEAVL